MIRNQWCVVMESRRVQDRPVGVTRMGEKLVFWRDAAGQVSCLRDQCVHRGAELSKGKVLHDGRLQCPFHGFEYDASGKVTRIPANGRDAAVPERFRVSGYPTHEAHGFIWLWWGDNPPAELPAPQFFDDIDDPFVYDTVYDPWHAHYSRVIENQLDPVHLPFVHRTTIGRGNRTLIEGPGIQWINDDKFYTYVYNKVDDGSTPRRPEEVPVPDPTRDYRLEFIFPNLWQNRISPVMRIVAAFVPVDDENTLMYLRVYQRFMKAPLPGLALSWMISRFNLVVAHQDRRVVVTQLPRASGLKIGERLIPGDRPIVEYRRRRQELMDQAQPEGGEGRP